jgi:hypothetical protein
VRNPATVECAARRAACNPKATGERAIRTRGAPSPAIALALVARYETGTLHLCAIHKRTLREYIHKCDCGRWYRVWVIPLAVRNGECIRCECGTEIKGWDDETPWRAELIKDSAKAGDTDLLGG